MGPRALLHKRKNHLMFAAASAALFALVGCSGGGTNVATGEIDEKYGVAASPRVVKTGKSIPKGGGRYMIGKPYKIAGKTYRPHEDPDYKKVGLASWYGDAFHGRLTANGEVYDMHRLTAAHTTMPLPSYARVTNVKNGRSVIVRVNDRGPFHGNRIIDLSKRTADLLDFKSAGIAKVKVEYVGKAQLDGRDDDFLVASYRGPGGVTPGGTFPGTRVASLDRTPPGSVTTDTPRSAPVVAYRSQDAKNPVSGNKPRAASPERRGERATAPRRLASAGTNRTSIDDEMLSFAGYGRDGLPATYGFQRVADGRGTSIAAEPVATPRRPGLFGRARPVGTRPPADVLGYAPSYATQSRIDRAFIAMGVLFSDGS
ncbi:MAG: septal ring lytic transglycosylase RlpA family protein [Pseudomonadota bacterium]